MLCKREPSRGTPRRACQSLVPFGASALARQRGPQDLPLPELRAALCDPPVAIALLRALALTRRQVVGVAEVLLCQCLQLLARRRAQRDDRVTEGADEPLDAIPPRVRGPPRVPRARVLAEVLPRDERERATRGQRRSRLL